MGDRRAQEAEILRRAETKRETGGKGEAYEFDQPEQRHSGLGEENTGKD